ncbi:MAG: hypothetical protein HYU75_20420, partial [Betaproteobacteria bacterium]|nr:hypothetical protein [Betaproteobacteria bacterium]
ARRADEKKSAELEHAAGIGLVMIEMPADAIVRLERATELAPNDAKALSDLAAAQYSVALARERSSLYAAALASVDRALRIDPNNVKAHALAGSVAYENRQFAQAASHWERVQGLIPSGSDFADTIRANIAEARGLAGAAENKRPRLPAPSAARAP